ncbi:hypothetical protein ENBRE01_0981 [Enteropsectra breve]|nr:hypothetical protein ENBRE01_0981 [Enteropsectra breve]
MQKLDLDQREPVTIENSLALCMNQITEEFTSVEISRGILKNLLIDKPLELKVTHPVIFRQLNPMFAFEQGLLPEDFVSYKSKYSDTGIKKVTEDEIALSSPVMRIRENEKETYVEKHNVGSLYIYMHDLKYDMCLTFYREVPKSAPDSFVSTVERKRYIESFDFDVARCEFIKSWDLRKYTKTNDGTRKYEYDLDLIIKLKYTEFDTKEISKLLLVID